MYVPTLVLTGSIRGQVGFATLTGLEAAGLWSSEPWAADVCRVLVWAPQYGEESVDLFG